MREFKVGDKVKFLNRTGGGIITKIVSPLVVNVEEDGFDIPTLTKEIILDYVDDKAGKMFTSAKEEKEVNIREEIQETKEQDNTERFYLSRKGQQMEKGVYLAFIPQDQVWILTQGFDVYLINNSDYYTLYSVILRQENGEFKGQDFGSLEAKERVHLASIQPSQADNWANGALQLLFHKDNDDKVFMPVSYQLKLRTAKFYKEGCFEYNDLTGCKAMVLPVAMIKDLQLFAVKGEEKVTKPIKEENQEAKPIAEKKPVSFFDKYMVNRLEAEVDLHIEELTEDDSKMQPFEKLTLQMEHFNKCLDEAIKRNLDKIVFIHGVGQGVLKKNIEEELNKYSFIHYFPASMQKYGVGATEVIIGKNRK